MEADAEGVSQRLEMPTLPSQYEVGYQQRFRKTEKLKIASLVRADSPRSTGEDSVHVQRLIEADWPLPPILVHRATMRIVDGFHRVSAAICKGADEIEAIMLDDSLDSAFLIAVHANVTHGLPLSLPDRRAAAATILQTHSEWSDRAIARATGLSAKTVNAIRCASAEDVQLDKRVGRTVVFGR